MRDNGGGGGSKMSKIAWRHLWTTPYTFCRPALPSPTTCISSVLSQWQSSSSQILKNAIHFLHPHSRSRELNSAVYPSGYQLVIRKIFFLQSILSEFNKNKFFGNQFQAEHSLINTYLPQFHAVWSMCSIYITVGLAVERSHAVATPRQYRASVLSDRFELHF